MKRTADLHDASSVVFFDVGIFPLGRGQIGIDILQLLTGDKGNLRIQFHPQLGIPDMQPVIGVADRPDDGPDDQLQVFQISVFPGNNFLPVPLVYVDGMDIIQIFIPADGVHICVQAIAYTEMIPLQRKTLPLSQ